MFRVDSTTGAEVTTARANAAKMQSIVATAADGFPGVFNIVSTAQPKGGQTGRINRYTVILRAIAGGYETTCGCEAGTPTHANQDVKLCKHVSVAMDAQKQAEIDAITAKYAAMGF